MRHHRRYGIALLMIATACLGWGVTVNAQQSSSDQQMGRTSDQSAQGTQQSQSQQQMGQTGSSGAQAFLPQGVTSKDLGGTGSIRDTLSSLTKNALNKGNWNDLTDNFVKADRDRLRSAGGTYPDELDRAIDQFSTAWHSKYNRAFTVDKDSAYNDQFLSVAQGTVDNPQQVKEWPVNPLGRSGGAMAQGTSNPSMNKGTEIAVATVNDPTRNQPIHASFVREGNDWKLDIPDNVTADDLKASLARHISAVNQMSSQWPSDPAAAQRVVTTHILEAIYSAGQRGASSSQPGASSQPGGSSSQGGGGGM